MDKNYFIYVLLQHSALVKSRQEGEGSAASETHTDCKESPVLKTKDTFRTWRYVLYLKFLKCLHVTSPNTCQEIVGQKFIST